MATKWYRSLIGGALGDEGFEPGDLIPVPPEKEQLWLDLGIVEVVKNKQNRIPKPTVIEMTELLDDAIADGHVSVEEDD